MKSLIVCLKMTLVVVQIFFSPLMIQLHDKLIIGMDFTLAMIYRSSSGGAPSTAPPKGLDSLVMEKKNLHAYLKAFEKF